MNGSSQSSIINRIEDTMIVPSTFLWDGFLPGSCMKICGTVKSDAVRFNVDFKNEDKDIAFHFNPRFNEKIIVRNTYTSGSWGEEEQGGEFLFARGESFTLFFRCEEEGIKVVLNDCQSFFYKHRHHPKTIKRFFVHGDVNICETDYTPAYERVLFAVLNDGFLPGSSIKICGTVNCDAIKFAVNFECESSDLAFHFNPRFNDNIIVRNTYTHCSWGMEERDGEFPFTRGESFTAIFQCEEERFKVVVNDSYSLFYNHRLRPPIIERFSVSGDAHICYLDYNPAC